MATMQSRSVRRREDVRLLTGRGSYSADQLPPGMLHAVPADVPLSLEIPMQALARTMPAIPRTRQMLDKTRRLLASL